MATTDFRFFFWNTYGARHSSYASWLLRRGRILRRMQSVKTEGYEKAEKASVYGLVETKAGEAAWYAKKLGKNYRYVASSRFSALIYHKDWKLGRQWVWPVDSAHDTLVVELTREGVRSNFIVTHLPPDLNGKSSAGKRMDVFDDIYRRTRKWSDPIVLGLDANWGGTFEMYAEKRGFKSARVGNAPTKGHRTIDYVLTKNNATCKWYTVLEEPARQLNAVENSNSLANGSDHNPISTGIRATSK